MSTTEDAGGYPLPSYSCRKGALAEEYRVSDKVKAVIYGASKGLEVLPQTDPSWHAAD